MTLYALWQTKLFMLLQSIVEIMQTHALQWANSISISKQEFLTNQEYSGPWSTL